jgi:glycosyltransferase involved in cell wall biosynthesis
MLLSEQGSNEDCDVMSREGSERLMLFSPWCYGHFPSYLRHLIEYQRSEYQRSLPNTLIIVVSPEFLQVHDEVVALVREGNHPNVQFVAMTAQEQASLESKTSGVGRAFAQHQLITEYARQMQATQVLIMYFDSCQLPLVLGRKLPCSFSGIYFRPTFHYKQIVTDQFTWKEQLQGMRERLFISRLIKHPQLKTLFCLDPFAVDAMNRLYPRKVVYLPDPVEQGDRSSLNLQDWRTRLGIGADRKIFLSFGRLADERKGIAQLMEAVSLLSPELCQQLCLLFVGEPDPAGIERMETWFAPVRQSLPVQIVTQYGYVPESEVAAYFYLSDAVLAPYQKHVGMSGILLQAAVAQKPVLSSNYGLMGAMVNRHCLGLAVDAAVPQAIALGLTQLLKEGSEVGDRLKMQSFADENSAKQFASVIFQHTSSSASPGS